MDEHSDSFPVLQGVHECLLYSTIHALSSDIVIITSFHSPFIHDIWLKSSHRLYGMVDRQNADVRKRMKS